MKARVWAKAAGTVLISIVALAPTFAQTTPFGKPVPDGPASAELRQLAKDDQADRAGFIQKQNGKMVFVKPTEEQDKRMSANDEKRRSRVRELLQANKLTTAEDFDNAALLFQHGATPDDYLTAHELSLVAFQLGKPSSMPALSEDRFLQSIGKTQRFGSQYAPAPSGKGYVLAPIVENTETAVTDGLRADFLIAPLDVVRREGPNALQVAIKPILDRLTRWQEPRKAKASKLSQTETRWLNANYDLGSDEQVAQVLKLYKADKLRTANEYNTVATRMLNARTENSLLPALDVLLLAHELAAVAFTHDSSSNAGTTVARMLDLYLLNVGQPQRYGTVRKDGVPVGTVSPTVTNGLRARFGVEPLTEQKKDAALTGTATKDR